jgi:serine/threonine-protein kinase RIO1
LTKVFDAEKEDYEKLRIKVFRIDFDVFKSGK